jgi:PleD family two-component response regulator
MSNLEKTVIQIPAQIESKTTQQKSTLVLIADDDAAARIVLRHLLEDQGYEVIEAQNGQECIRSYLQFHPDLVLLDCVMPVMDGYACCQNLRSLPNIDDTPIVMLTSLNDSNSMQRAFSLGVTDYIPKPIQWDSFSQRITQLVKQTKSLQEWAIRNAGYRRQRMLDDLSEALNQQAFALSSSL